MPDGPFVDAVTDKLAFLLGEHGFRVTEASEHVVLLETPALCVQAVRDPRGEVDVNVFRRGKLHAGMCLQRHGRPGVSGAAAGSRG